MGPSDRGACVTAPDEAGELTAFQVDAARLFFALPESSGFLLAGGAGLLAQHLTHRPTQDLDFFTHIGPSVPAARDAFEIAARNRSWSVLRIRDTATFCRLMVTGGEELLIDLALDSPPQLPPKISFLGPTFAPEELAARKLLALFDRAEARDFTDIYELSRIFDQTSLMERAATIDLGFTSDVLAQSIAALNRFKDLDIPIEPSEVPALRAFFRDWMEQLHSD